MVVYLFLHMFVNPSKYPHINTQLKTPKLNAEELIAGTICIKCISYSFIFDMLYNEPWLCQTSNWIIIILIIMSLTHILVALVQY